MKSVTLPILILVSTLCFGQSFRLHIGGGFANYIGDIQQRRLSFDQVKGMYAFGAAYEINDKVTLRVDFSTAQVAGDDKKGKTARILKRNLNFQSPIQEVAFVGEYNLMNNYTAPVVPYFFIGMGIFKFNPYTHDDAGRKVFLHDLSTEGQGLSKYPNRRPYSLRQINIPFGGGFKYNLTENIYFGVEGGIRKLFTDYLDDVSTTYADKNTLVKDRGQKAVDLSFRTDELPGYANQAYPKEGAQRGNKDKDWYYFAQFKISFRLKGNEGFGNGVRTNNKGFLRRLGCPGRF